jgi:hypothetical protein
VDESSFAIQAMIGSHAPAPPDFGSLEDLLLDDDLPATAKSSSRGSTRPGTSGALSGPGTSGMPSRPGTAGYVSEGGEGVDAVVDEQKVAAERAVSREAARNALARQQQVQAHTTEELRSVILEMRKLSLAVEDMKQNYDRIDKASALPVTAVTVTSNKRSPSVSEVARENRQGSVSARPPLSRPRPSTASAPPRRSYSTSLATEAARQATEEVLEASRMRTMRSEMAALKEEVDRVRAVAMNSIHIAQKSAASQQKQQG